MTATSSRAGIYYWKCDRAAAFHGTAQGAGRMRPELEAQLRSVLARHFGGEPPELREGGGQGNHLTFIARLGGAERFVRVEDGPEHDDYLAVESHVLGRVRALGVPAPRVLGADASRRDVPFAWQVLELVPQPDLNRHFKAGTLDAPAIAMQLGRLVAQWQAIPVAGFGPFAVDALARDARLEGLHASYASYFRTRLEAHLAFLVERKFLATALAAEIAREIEHHRALLELPSGCLVHKDLALWNVLGTEREVTAVIDWDDCVGGDPMDDLSLLACFHDGAFLRGAFAGYAAVRALPAEHVRRFWLHLLRNMLFKAVIRVGAGYFERDSSFFLIGGGGTGGSLREQTLGRLAAAVDGLRTARDPFTL